MTNETPTPRRRRRGRGIRPWLILVKLLGLAAFFGGLASLSALGLFAPAPREPEGWLLLKGAMRAIFRPCVLGGLLVAVAAGLALFSLHPREFVRMRWFRLKMTLVVIGLPSLHLWARGRVTEFYGAIDDSRMGELESMWRGVTTAFIVALVVTLGVAAIGRFKPRLGERLGARGKEWR